MRNTLISAAVLAVLVSAPAALSQKAKEAAPKPPSITKVVVKQVKAAQDAIKGEKWADCVASLKSTESLPGQSPYDVFAVNELLGFCSARVGDTAGAAKSFEIGLEAGFIEPSQLVMRYKQLLQLHYNLKNYTKAVDYGRRAIAAGNTEEPVSLLVAQSLYLLNDYKGTVEFVQGWIAGTEQRGETPPDIGLQLYVSACSRLEDGACTLRALEKQAAYHPKSETWPNISLLLLRSGTEGNTLNVFRLSKEAGGLRRADDYTEMAQLAIEKGLPGEAQSVLEAGLASGTIATGPAADLAKRLLATAKTQAAADKPTLLKQDAEAAAKKNGEIDSRIGLAHLSYGDNDRAIAALQRALDKGNARNPDETRLNLGIAQLRSGQKDAALASFSAVNGEELQRLARLWSLRAK